WGSFWKSSLTDSRRGEIKHVFRYQNQPGSPDVLGSVEYDNPRGLTTKFDLTIHNSSASGVHSAVVKLPDGNSLSMSYSGVNSYLAAAKSPSGNTTIVGALFGWMTGVGLPDQTTALFTYEPGNERRLTELKDPFGMTEKYEYANVGAAEDK